MAKGQNKRKEVKKKKAQRNSSFTFVEETLRDVLKTKVNITYRKNKGKIIIEFYSKDDLERIMSIFSEKDE